MQEHGGGQGGGQGPNVNIHIDNEVFHVPEHALTGAQLRALPVPAIGPERDLWLDVPGGNDRLVGDDELVELRNGQHFFTAPSTINPGR